MSAKKAAKKVSKPAARKTAKKAAKIAPAKAAKAKETPAKKAAKKAAAKKSTKVTKIPTPRNPPLVRQVTGPEAHAPADNTPPIIDADTVRTAAYLNYSHRTSTGAPGDALGDWLAAETSLKK